MFRATPLWVILTMALWLLLGGRASNPSSRSVCREGTCRVIVSEPGRTVEVKDHQVRVVQYSSDGPWVQVDGSTAVVTSVGYSERVGPVAITVISIDQPGDVVFDVK